MIIMVLFAVAMFLWLLTLLPFPPLAPWQPAGGFLAFISVLLLGLSIFFRF